MGLNEQPNERQQRSKKPIWAAGITAVGLLLLVAFAVAVGRGSGYRRFVSKPLLDGTRYTFLYPEYLTRISENGKGASPNVIANVNLNTPYSGQTQISRFLGWLKMAPSVTAESITVVVFPSKTTVLKDSTESREWPPNFFQRQDQAIKDVRTNNEFVLMYSCEADRIAQYRRNHLSVTSSFRLLHPGEPDP